MTLIALAVEGLGTGPFYATRCPACGTSYQWIRRPGEICGDWDIDAPAACEGRVELVKE